MLDFRRNAAGILKRLARGESLLLSHRGKPAARLEPVGTPSTAPNPDDPFLTIGHRAQPSPLGATAHKDIDTVLYGRH